MRPARALAAPPTLTSYASPWEFLVALSRRLRCPVKRLPAPRAMAELLTYFEALQAVGQPIPDDFLRTGALLLTKLSELPFDASYDQLDDLAAHLRCLNENRPQAVPWTEHDWRRLARLVFEHRHLSTAVYFGPHPPFAWNRERELELPFCARYVEHPPAFGQTRLPTTSSDSLFEEAQALIQSISSDLKEAREALTQLKILDSKLPPRHPGLVRRSPH